MLTKHQATQVRELMKLVCWPVALILIIFGRVDEGMLVAALGEISSGAASRVSK